MNESFISTDPDFDVLSAYPPLWPHIEYIGAGVRHISLRLSPFSDDPNLVLIVLNLWFVTQGLTGNFTSLFVPNAVLADVGRFFYSLLGVLVAPQSRGTVTLASSDPTVLPVIDPAWLTSPTDQKVAIEVYRKIRRIFQTAAFKAARLNDEEFYPGESQYRCGSCSWMSSRGAGHDVYRARPGHGRGDLGCYPGECPDGVARLLYLRNAAPREQRRAGSLPQSLVRPFLAI